MSSAAQVTGFVPVSASTGDPVKLSMQQLWLTGQLLPVGARLVVRHVFSSDHDEPAEVIYAFGLPRDAALRSFRVEGDGFTMHSQLEPVEVAVEAYETGIREGHLATLARLYRDGVANLSVGNVRPGETLSVYVEIVAGVDLQDGGLRFRFPFTLSPAYHREATVSQLVPETIEVELPQEQFGDVILPPVRADASGLHEVGFDLDVRMAGAITRVASPSHAISVESETAQDDARRVRLQQAADLPNRDLVLDVRTADTEPQSLAGLDEEGRGHFAVVIPSTFFGELPSASRRVVFVLDRSGSMNGPPIEQAKKALAACLGALSRDDEFGFVSFSSDVDAMQPTLVKADVDGRQMAERYLERIAAGGGTELLAAIEEGARLLDHGGGDLVVLTDGQVHGTEDILAGARSAQVRVHCLGIGSASQDRFLALLARKTGGVSRFVTPRERVDMSAVELFAAVGRPVASDLTVKLGGIDRAVVEPTPPSFVLSGKPLVVWGRAEGPGEGKLAISWESGQEKKEAEISLPMTAKAPAVAASAGALGTTLATLRGARLITDMESRILHGRAGAGARRERKRLTERLEELSRQYELTSQEMALVAVLEREGDEPGAVPRTSVVPVGMPQDTAFYAYAGRRSKSSDLSLGAAKTLSAGLEPRTMLTSLSDSSAPAFLRPRRGRRPSGEKRSTDDALLQLAGVIAADGGLPGDEAEERVARTVLTILALVGGGSTVDHGPFSPHLKRMVEYLKTGDMKTLSRDRHSLVETVVQMAEGTGQPGDSWADDARWLADRIEGDSDGPLKEEIWGRVRGLL